jgi:hypothetical protein
MTKKLASKGAQLCGINMDVECAWIGPPNQDGFTPFGPDPIKDNIFQNLPQVNLHGMDEGLTLKMCVNILHATIKEAKTLHKMNTTSVSDPNVALRCNTCIMHSMSTHSNNQIINQIHIQIINQSNNRINNQINIQILIHIINQTINQIHNQISNQISNQITHQ